MSEAATSEMEAAADLHHAWFTGSILACVTRRGAGDAADLVFRVFRHQQQETFLPGLAKLGLDRLPPAVAAARYHYHSNAIGGVGVEYHEESPRKAWIRYPPPRWIWAGTAICAIPSEVNVAMLRGWHANNGVMLGRLGLGFVCTGQTVDGDPGLEGYYIEHARDLALDERLTFRRDERMPRVDVGALPRLSTADWPADRLAKAKRNYAMTYAGSLMLAAVAAFGEEAAGRLLGASARLIGLQSYRMLADRLALPADAGLDAFMAFVAAIVRGQGDRVLALEQTKAGWVLVQSQPRLPGASTSPAHWQAWHQLMAGALAAHDRFATLTMTRGADGRLTWAVSR